jgi:hypothetical protein
MVSQEIKYVMIGIYSVLIIAIAVVLYKFIGNNKKAGNIEKIIPHHHVPPHHHLPPSPSPTNSYFSRDKTFNNKEQTTCIKDLIQKFRQLSHPLNLIFADKGTYIQPVVATDKAVMRTTWKRLCNAINTGIKTCPDMRVRYIVPQGANEQIEFVNDNGKVYIPKGVRFHCEDYRLPPIYFRLNHKGAGITFAINIPDLS